MHEDQLKISYLFRLPDGGVKIFEIALDRPSLRLNQRTPQKELPEWTRLEHEQCPNCPLRAESHPRCPVAVSMVGVIETFGDVLSHEHMDVEVTTASRVYSARVRNTLAVGSLIGVYMVTSGCPIMDRLRPMVLTHLPFATTEESIYRAMSAYLLAQFFRWRRGLDADWEMARLGDFYEDVNTVNQSFVKRLTTFVEGDAPLNAVVLLNCFGAATRRAISQEKFLEIEPLFSAHLGDAPDC